MIVIDTTYADDDAGGTLSRYFEKYTLIAEVRFSGLGEKLVYADFGPDDQKNFILDVRGIAQRGFKDILSHEGMRPGLPWDELVEADGYITQTYGMAVWPGYMEPDANGVNRFTEFRKDDEVKVLGLTCVNAVQPYHETNINGGVVLSWQEDLVPYLVNESSTGSDEARFLTYAPEDGQIVREGDDVFLAFLWNGARVSYCVVMRTYDSSWYSYRRHTRGAATTRPIGGHTCWTRKPWVGDHQRDGKLFCGVDAERRHHHQHADHQQVHV